MKSIRTKMILSIVVPTLVLYVLILGGTMVFLRDRALANVEQTMTRMASNYAGRFDGFLREAAALADTSAVSLGLQSSPPEEVIFSQLRANLTDRPFIYGSCAAFEPGTIRGTDELYAPYVHRSGESVAKMNITRSVYDWYADPQWTWFQEPKRLNRGVWSVPYFDEGAGNVLMTTYSAPFSHKDEFRGVTTVDIDLSRLNETIGGEAADNNKFFVLAQDGRFVYCDRPEWVLNRTIADVARDDSNRELGAIIPRMLGGHAGVATVPGWSSPRKQLLFFAPISSADWTFVAYVPEDVALAGLRTQLTIAGGGLAATLLLIVVSIVFVSGRITKPLTALTDGARKIESGDLETRVTGAERRDEIGRLASAFNSMAARLREHITRLAEEESTRRKLEHDLEIAREIQRGLLPAQHPELPGYDVAGWTRSADQTGGDYYDWQMLDDGTITISLADVTGHGIGPALVTAACRAYARASFAQSGELSGAMDRINTLIHDDLHDGRFVTYVAARVQPKTHRVQMLSAGHGPLLLYRSKSEQVEQFDAHHIPLGIMSGETYGPPSSFDLLPGDFLMFITDGFFEWANADGEQYGLERLASRIQKLHGEAPRAIIEGILDDVLHFTAGTKQLDDLTAVVLKRSSV